MHRYFIAASGFYCSVRKIVVRESPKGTIDLEIKSVYFSTTVQSGEGRQELARLSLARIKM